MKTNFEPFVYETLMSVIGKFVIGGTTHDTAKGKLADVKPDHIVLQDCLTQQSLFTRIRQIATIIPI